jgi:hypothetical protein
MFVCFIFEFANENGFVMYLTDCAMYMADCLYYLLDGFGIQLAFS